MQSIFKRFLGLLIILLSVASLLLSFYLIRQIWLMKDAATDRLLATTAEARGFLDYSEQTLDVLDTITSQASLTISTTQTSLLTLAQATHDTSGMLDPIITLTGETLPDFITSTQDSVNSAKDTAQLIDGIMSAISKIPFINQPYDPKKSLSASLTQISSDLDRFNPQLQTMVSDLKESQTNLNGMERQVTDFSSNLGATQDALGQSRTIIGKYKDQVMQLQDELSSLEKRLPGMVLDATIAILFCMIWLVILQGYIAYRGLTILFHPRQQRADSP